METAMQDKRIPRILLWLLGIALVFAGLAADHKYGGQHPPAPPHAPETMVMPNASNPT